MIFSKGKARSMRIDKKKTLKKGEPCYMSGCNGMLPIGKHYENLTYTCSKITALSDYGACIS